MLAGVVSLVDIVSGELSVEKHFEATKQIAFADRIVLTKTDLAHDPASIRDIQSLRAKLAILNPAAPITDLHASGSDLADLFRPRAYLPVALGDDVTGWLALDEAIRSEVNHHPTIDTETPTAPLARHGGRIRTFAITRDEPVEQKAFHRLLDLLAATAGPRLLRVKGLVHECDEPQRPRVIHAVQHIVHPPAVLDSWPSEDRRTRLVFITDGVESGPVRELFASALDNRPTRVGRMLSKLAGTLTSALCPRSARLGRTATR